MDLHLVPGDETCGAERERESAIELSTPGMFQKYGIIMFCCREKQRSHQVQDCRISSNSRSPNINHLVVVTVDEDSPAAPSGPPK